MLRTLDGKPFVYFVRATPVDLIKIGFTTSIRSRLSNLTTDNACSIALVGLMPVKSKASEALLHKQFAALRDHGEWFRPDAKLLKVIEKKAPLPEAIVQELQGLPDHGLERQLLAITETDGIPNVMMRTKQLAQCLQVSRMTILRHVRNGMLPHCMIKRQIRFYVPDVLEFFKEKGYAGATEALDKWYTAASPKLHLVSANPDEMMTLEEIADWLHTMPAVIMHDVAMGTIRAYHVGRQLRFRPQEVLDSLVKSQKRLSKPTDGRELVDGEDDSSSKTDHERNLPERTEPATR